MCEGWRIKVRESLFSLWGNSAEHDLRVGAIARRVKEPVWTRLRIDIPYLRVRFCVSIDGCDFDSLINSSSIGSSAFRRCGETAKAFLWVSMDLILYFSQCK